MICIYNTGTRELLLSELGEMQGHLEPDETELLELTKTVISKLAAMSDMEFESIAGELVGDFE